VRVLGGTASVAQCQRAAGPPAQAAPRLVLAPLVARARAGIADLWTEVLGHPGRPLAPVLGLFPAAVYKAARRGAAEAPVWQRLSGSGLQEK